MAVNDRCDLRHHLAGVQRDQHVMARLRQIGDEAGAIDRLVEDLRRDAIEQRFVAGSDLPDLDADPLHARSSSPRRCAARASGGS
jgi:hypothetical protein